MSINLSSEQKEEAKKLLNYIHKMESIVRTTPNEEQKNRVKKELFRYQKKLVEISPLLDIGKKSSEAILNELDGNEADNSRQNENLDSQASNSDTPAFRVIDKIKIEPACENCQDADINFLSSIFRNIHLEYWPAMSDRHTKLDFSNAQERDGIRIEIDNVLRNLSVLTETMDEFTKAEKQDFREQLLKMKNRQSRNFIYESNEALKKLRSFLKKLSEDVNGRGGIVMNKDEKIKFNSKYEKSTILEGHTVKQAILEFSSLVSESISHLNLPDLKIK